MVGQQAAEGHSLGFGQKIIQIRRQGLGTQVDLGGILGHVSDEGALHVRVFLPGLILIEGGPDGGDVELVLIRVDQDVEHVPVTGVQGHLEVPVDLPYGTDGVAAVLQLGDGALQAFGDPDLGSHTIPQSHAGVGLLQLGAGAVRRVGDRDHGPGVAHMDVVGIGRFHGSVGIILGNAGLGRAVLGHAGIGALGTDHTVGGDGHFILGIGQGINVPAVDIRVGVGQVVGARDVVGDGVLTGSAEAARHTRVMLVHGELDLHVLVIVGLDGDVGTGRLGLVAVAHNEGAVAAGIDTVHVGVAHVGGLLAGGLVGDAHVLQRQVGLLMLDVDVVVGQGAAVLRLDDDGEAGHLVLQHVILADVGDVALLALDLAGGRVADHSDDGAGTLVTVVGHTEDSHVVHGVADGVVPNRVQGTVDVHLILGLPAVAQDAPVVQTGIVGQLVVADVVDLLVVIGLGGIVGIGEVHMELHGDIIDILIGKIQSAQADQLVVVVACRALDGLLGASLTDGDTDLQLSHQVLGILGGLQVGVGIAQGLVVALAVVLIVGLHLVQEAVVAVVGIALDHDIVQRPLAVLPCGGLHLDHIVLHGGGVGLVQRQLLHLAREVLGVGVQVIQLDGDIQQVDLHHVGADHAVHGDVDGQEVVVVLVVQAGDLGGQDAARGTDVELVVSLGHGAVHLQLGRHGGVVHVVLGTTDLDGAGGCGGADLQGGGTAHVEDDGGAGENAVLTHVQGHVLAVHADVVQVLVHGVLTDDRSPEFLLAGGADGDGYPGLVAQQDHVVVGELLAVVGDGAALVRDAQANGCAGAEAQLLTLGRDVLEGSAHLHLRRVGREDILLEDNAVIETLLKVHVPLVQTVQQAGLLVVVSDAQVIVVTVDGIALDIGLLVIGKLLDIVELLTVVGLDQEHLLSLDLHDQIAEVHLALADIHLVSLGLDGQTSLGIPVGGEDPDLQRHIGTVVGDEDLNGQVVIRALALQGDDLHPVLGCGLASGRFFRRDGLAVSIQHQREVVVGRILIIGVGQEGVVPLVPQFDTAHLAGGLHVEGHDRIGPGTVGIPQVDHVTHVDIALLGQALVGGTLALAGAQADLLQGHVDQAVAEDHIVVGEQAVGGLHAYGDTPLAETAHVDRRRRVVGVAGVTGLHIGLIHAVYVQVHLHDGGGIVGLQPELGGDRVDGQVDDEDALILDHALLFAFHVPAGAGGVDHSVLHGPGLVQTGVLGLAGHGQVVDAGVALVLVAGPHAGHGHLEVELGSGISTDGGRAEGATGAATQGDAGIHRIGSVDFHLAGPYCRKAVQIEVEHAAADLDLPLIDGDVVEAAPAAQAGGRRGDLGDPDASDVVGIPGQANGQVQIQGVILAGNLHEHDLDLGGQVVVSRAVAVQIHGVAILRPQENGIEDGLIQIHGQVQLIAGRHAPGVGALAEGKQVVDIHILGALGHLGVDVGGVHAGGHIGLVDRDAVEDHVTAMLRVGIPGRRQVDPAVGILADHDVVPKLLGQDVAGQVIASNPGAGRDGAGIELLDGAHDALEGIVLLHHQVIPAGAVVLHGQLELDRLVVGIHHLGSQAVVDLDLVELQHIVPALQDQGVGQLLTVAQNAADLHLVLGGLGVGGQRQGHIAGVLDKAHVAINRVVSGVVNVTPAAGNAVHGEAGDGIGDLEGIVLIDGHHIALLIQDTDVGGIGRGPQAHIHLAGGGSHRHGDQTVAADGTGVPVGGRVQTTLVAGDTDLAQAAVHGRLGQVDDIELAGGGKGGLGGGQTVGLVEHMDKDLPGVAGEGAHRELLGPLGVIPEAGAVAPVDAGGDGHPVVGILGLHSDLETGVISADHSGEDVGDLVAVGIQHQVARSVGGQLGHLHIGGILGVVGATVVDPDAVGLLHHVDGSLSLVVSLILHLRSGVLSPEVGILQTADELVGVGGVVQFKHGVGHVTLVVRLYTIRRSHLDVDPDADLADCIGANHAPEGGEGSGRLAQGRSVVGVGTARKRHDGRSPAVRLLIVDLGLGRRPLVRGLQEHCNGAARHLLVQEAVVDNELGSISVEGLLGIGHEQRVISGLGLRRGGGILLQNGSAGIVGHLVIAGLGSGQIQSGLSGLHRIDVPRSGSAVLDEVDTAVGGQSPDMDGIGHGQFGLAALGDDGDLEGGLAVGVQSGHLNGDRLSVGIQSLAHITLAVQNQDHLPGAGHIPLAHQIHVVQPGLTVHHADVAVADGHVVHKTGSIALDGAELLVADERTLGLQGIVQLKLVGHISHVQLGGIAGGVQGHHILVHPARLGGSGDGHHAIALGGVHAGEIEVVVAILVEQTVQLIGQGLSGEGLVSHSRFTEELDTAGGLHHQLGHGAGSLLHQRPQGQVEVRVVVHGVGVLVDRDLRVSGIRRVGGHHVVGIHQGIHRVAQELDLGAVVVLSGHQELLLPVDRGLGDIQAILGQDHGGAVALPIEFHLTHGVAVGLRGVPVGPHQAQSLDGGIHLGVGIGIDGIQVILIEADLAHIVLHPSDVGVDIAQVHRVAVVAVLQDGIQLGKGHPLSIRGAAVQQSLSGLHGLLQISVAGHQGHAVCSADVAGLHGDELVGAGLGLDPDSVPAIGVGRGGEGFGSGIHPGLPVHDAQIHFLELHGVVSAFGLLGQVLGALDPDGGVTGGGHVFLGLLAHALGAVVQHVHVGGGIGGDTGQFLHRGSAGGHVGDKPVTGGILLGGDGVVLTVEGEGGLHALQTVVIAPGVELDVLGADTAVAGVGLQTLDEHGHQGQRSGRLQLVVGIAVAQVSSGGPAHGGPVAGDCQDDPVLTHGGGIHIGHVNLIGLAGGGPGKAQIRAGHGHDVVHIHGIGVGLQGHLGQGLDGPCHGDLVDEQGLLIAGQDGDLHLGGLGLGAVGIHREGQIGAHRVGGALQGSGRKVHGGVARQADSHMAAGTLGGDLDGELIDVLHHIDRAGQGGHAAHSGKEAVGPGGDIVGLIGHVLVIDQGGIGPQAGVAVSLGDVQPGGLHKLGGAEAGHLVDVGQAGGIGGDHDLVTGSGLRLQVVLPTLGGILKGDLVAILVVELDGTHTGDLGLDVHEGGDQSGVAGVGVVHGGLVDGLAGGGGRAHVGQGVHRGLAGGHHVGSGHVQLAQGQIHEPDGDPIDLGQLVAAHRGFHTDIDVLGGQGGILDRQGAYSCRQSGYIDGGDSRTKADGHAGSAVGGHEGQITLLADALGHVEEVVAVVGGILHSGPGLGLAVLGIGNALQLGHAAGGVELGDIVGAECEALADAVAQIHGLSVMNGGVDHHGIGRVGGSGDHGLVDGAPLVKREAQGLGYAVELDVHGHTAVCCFGGTLDIEVRADRGGGAVADGGNILADAAGTGGIGHQVLGQVGQGVAALSGLHGMDVHIHDTDLDHAGGILLGTVAGDDPRQQVDTSGGTGQGSIHLGTGDGLGEGALLVVAQGRLRRAQIDLGHGILGIDGDVGHPCSGGQGGHVGPGLVSEVVHHGVDGYGVAGSHGIGIHIVLVLHDPILALRQGDVVVSLVDPQVGDLVRYAGVGIVDDDLYLGVGNRRGGHCIQPVTCHIPGALALIGEGAAHVAGLHSAGRVVGHNGDLSQGIQVRDGDLIEVVVHTALVDGLGVLDGRNLVHRDRLQALHTPEDDQVVGFLGAVGGGHVQIEVVGGVGQRCILHRVVILLGRRHARGQLELGQGVGAGDLDVGLGHVAGHGGHVGLGGRIQDGLHLLGGAGAVHIMDPDALHLRVAVDVVDLDVVGGALAVAGHHHLEDDGIGHAADADAAAGVVVSRAVQSRGVGHPGHGESGVGVGSPDIQVQSGGRVGHGLGVVGAVGLDALGTQDISKHVGHIGDLGLGQLQVHQVDGYGVGLGLALVGGGDLDLHLGAVPDQGQRQGGSTLVGDRGANGGGLSDSRDVLQGDGGHLPVGGGSQVKLGQLQIQTGGIEGAGRDVQVVVVGGPHLGGGLDHGVGLAVRIIVGPGDLLQSGVVIHPDDL